MTGLWVRRLACVLPPLLVATAVCAFIAYDATARDLPDQPKIVNGVIDLAGYDEWSGSEIPLDGEWEFFWKQWIVSDAGSLSEPIDNIEPSCMIDVPSSWKGKTAQGETLGLEGWASYRIHVKNCSVSQLAAYIPDCNTPYRVYMDGYEVINNGKLSKVPSETYMRTTQFYSAANRSVAHDFDIVIEVASVFTGGLYEAPRLMTQRDATVSNNIISYVQAAFLGIVVMSLAQFLLIRVFRDGEFDTLPLAALSLLLFILIFAHSQIAHLKVFDPLSQHYTPLWLITIVALYAIPIILHQSCSRLQRQGPSKALTVVLCSLAVVGFALTGAFMSAPTPERTFILTCVSIASMAIASSGVMYRYWLHGGWESFALGAASFALIGALFLNAWYWRGFGFLNVSLLLGFVCICYLLVILCIYIRRKAIAQRQELDARKAQVRLREAETQLMLSQIQPHFIYNTLTAVLALIDMNPRRASGLLLDFTQYLRTNIDSLKKADLIEFGREMNHIKTYLAIEQARLGPRLKTSFACDAVDFLVPQLCVQPFVENAVRHGVSQREEGGSVTLSSWETIDAFHIRVADTGVGFDADETDPGESAHVGISNAVYRFKEMMNAHVRIESEPDKGTVVTISIPKEHDRVTKEGVAGKEGTNEK